MKNFYLSLLFLFVCLDFINGQSIFSNEITDSNPSNDNPYINGQVIDENITVSGIGRGPNIEGRNTTNRYNARGWDTAAIDLDAYYEFTLVPNAGFEIDLVNFQFSGQTTGQAPNEIAIRSSIDGFTSNIGAPLLSGSTIDLSDANYQNVNSAISFRIYAWNANNFNGTFSINDFRFNGSVGSNLCTSTTTWTSTGWDNGTPDSDTAAILDFAYNTDTNGAIDACTITINNGITLTVSNNTYINLKNELITDGTIIVEPQGSVVQDNDASINLMTGNIIVQKETTVLNGPLEYTYWSSPVVGETVENVFSNVPTSRRFTFNAANFVDLLAEVDNTGTFVSGQDDIDDNGDAWQYASGTLTAGRGYAATASAFGPFPAAQQFTFQGELNNGTIQIALVNASGDVYNDWNFIGNPYPSAISTDAFFLANAGLVDNIYLWSQATPLNAEASGNDSQNFSGADYAVISASGVNTAGGSTVIPNNFVPSGQGFFVEALSDGNITFNNSMRVTGNNDQFFRSSATTSSNRDVIWLNLTSDNGVFNQIAVAHIPGATNENDGTYFDVPRNVSSNSYAKLYSTISGHDGEFVIQGKNVSSLNLDEIIKLGFSSTIESPTIFAISIGQSEGDFYSENNIYLKDNLLNTIHDLKDSDYNFTSETGVFNERFEVVFNAEKLSTKTFDIEPNQLSIVELPNGNIEFSVNSDLKIKTISIIDVLGRTIYKLEGDSNSETYDLSNLNKAAFIARVTFSNGQTISKKAIKQQ